MNNTELLEQKLKEDIHGNLDALKLYFDTKRRFDKKKELSGWDFLAAAFVSFNAAFSFKKTWEDGKQLISELQKQETIAAQNNALLLWQASKNPLYLTEYFNSGNIPVFNFNGDVHTSG